MSDVKSLIEQASEDQLPAVIPTTGLDALLAADLVSFLPYLSMIQQMSNLNNPGENHVDAGNWALIENKKPLDLGTELDVKLLAVRALAWKYGPEVNIRCYDDTDPIFAEVMEMSKFSRQDLQARGDNNTYTWGGEYLVYLPKLEKFATFHACSRSERISAGQDFHELVPHRPLITWFSEFFTSAKNKASWYLLKTKDCNTGDQYPGMDIDLANTVIDNFNSPPAIDSVDPATETEAQ